MERLLEPETSPVIWIVQYRGQAWHYHNKADALRKKRELIINGCKPELYRQEGLFK